MTHPCPCDPSTIDRSFHCDILNRKMYRRHAELCGTKPSYREYFEDGTAVPITERPRLELGDLVERGLSLVGITEERVTSWIGRPCGCDTRKERLNQVSKWARDLVMGQADDSELLAILNEPSGCGK